MTTTNRSGSPWCVKKCVTGSHQSMAE
jgi:hypothetical protein